MGKKTVKQVKHSIRGMIDCHISLTQDLFRTYGINMSDAICMGISDTFGFDVWIEKYSKIPYLAILGREPSTDKVIYEKFNFDFIEKRAIEKESFSKEVSKCIDEEVCVLARVDRYYLPYLEKKFPATHFGQHWVLIFGIKQEMSGIYYGLYDVFFRTPLWVSEVDIHRARNSDWQPYPPEALYFIVKKKKGWKKPEKEEIAEFIRDGARKTAQRMLSSKDRGINGMRIAADELTMLIQKMADNPKLVKILRRQYFMLKSMVGEFEPSHSMYRIPYSKFLWDSRKKYGIFTNLQCSQMEEIGQKWRELYLKMLKSEALDGINLFIQHLRIIAEDEKKIFSDIYDYLS